ncbi:DUF2525 domain-containing protein, partial [Mycobacterium tuberculosis]|nr:DUF2525 domain-containing protein [Mycobacterium tuberculosis]
FELGIHDFSASEANR